jgi:hypothetical protein
METPKEPVNTGQIMVQRDEKGRILSGSVLNPAGKPKGVKHLSTLLLERLSEASKGGQTIDEDIIIQKVIDMAKEGNMRAIELIWERMEGKALQPIIQHLEMGPALTDEQKARLDSLMRKK